MDHQTVQRTSPWPLVRRQHAVITREQLLALGYGPEAIKHRVRTGRLHPKGRGIYAIGRAELTRRGEWMAAVLGCGPEAALSHPSAAALWGIAPDDQTAPIEVTVPPHVRRDRPNVVVHRAERDLTRVDDIPVTTPTCTLVDLAASLDARALEAAVNAADTLDLVDPETLRDALDTLTRRPGLARLQRLLDRRTFTLTDSDLERLFLPLARAAGLPLPETGVWVSGYEADFHWPEIGLVVETDGLRYHRTPAQRARDRLRDQTHTAAGLTPLRFTHAQIAFARRHVHRTLAAVAARLSR
jgi:very-short-patch-repair endonuclease